MSANCPPAVRASPTCSASRRDHISINTKAYEVELYYNLCFSERPLTVLWDISVMEVFALFLLWMRNSSSHLPSPTLCTLARSAWHEHLKTSIQSLPLSHLCSPLSSRKWQERQVYLFLKNISSWELLAWWRMFSVIIVFQTLHVVLITISSHPRRLAETGVPSPFCFPSITFCHALFPSFSSFAWSESMLFKSSCKNTPQG